MFSQGPQGGLSSQNGSSFNSMTAGTAGAAPLTQAPPQWGGAQGGGQQQGMPQQTPPRGPTRKEAAAVHDPFAALTGGLTLSEVLVVNQGSASFCFFCVAPS